MSADSTRSAAFGDLVPGLAAKSVPWLVAQFCSVLLRQSDGSETSGAETPLEWDARDATARGSDSITTFPSGRSSC